MSASAVWPPYVQALQDLQRLLVEDDPDSDLLVATAMRVEQSYAGVQNEVAVEANPDDAIAAEHMQQALELVQSIQQRAEQLCQQWRSAGTLDERRRRALGAYAGTYRQGDARYLDQRR